MISFNIQVSKQAENDLIGIYEYIAFELQSLKSAKEQLDRLEKGILSLEQMPERYRVYEKEPWSSRNLRVMIIDNFVVLYIPDEQKNIVTVVRVMYGGRNIEKQLKE